MALISKNNHCLNSIQEVSRKFDDFIFPRKSKDFWIFCDSFFDPIKPARYLISFQTRKLLLIIFWSLKFQQWKAVMTQSEKPRAATNPFQTSPPRSPSTWPRLTAPTEASASCTARSATHRSSTLSGSTTTRKSNHQPTSSTSRRRTRWSSRSPRYSPKVIWLFWLSWSNLM